MEPTSLNFKAQARDALADKALRSALSHLSGNVGRGRDAAIAALPEFDALRDRAVEIKNHTLEYLDFYLEKFEEKVKESGGHVHWCRGPEEARSSARLRIKLRIVARGTA